MIPIDKDTAVELVVNAVALTDDGDFKTPKTSVAYNAAGMSLKWIFTTTAGVVTITTVTPDNTGDYLWTHVSDGYYKIAVPASGGASINNDVAGVGYFEGSATGVLPWRSANYVFRAAGINDLLVDSAYSTTRGLAGTALPNAAADAAGGLPISDAGGLDLDNRMPVAAAVANLNTVYDTDFGSNYSTSLDRFIVQLAPATHTSAVIPTVTTTGTATNLTNLPSIPNNWITSGGIAAGALDNKGNWNVGKTGYTLSQSFPANFAALGINASGHVEQVVLVDTTTTNTDMRGTDGASTFDASNDPVKLDHTQTLPATPTVDTVGEALKASRAQAFGNWSLDSGTNRLKLYAPDGTTVLHEFTIGPNLTAPLTRTTVTP